MRTSFLIIIAFFLFLSSCSLFENDPKPLEPIYTYFYAEINGERIDAKRVSAAITSSGGKSFINFSGSNYAEELFPFSEKIILL